MHLAHFGGQACPSAGGRQQLVGGVPVVITGAAAPLLPRSCGGANVGGGMPPVIGVVPSAAVRFAAMLSLAGVRPKGGVALHLVLGRVPGGGGRLYTSNHLLRHCNRKSLGLSLLTDSCDLCHT